MSSRLVSIVLCGTVATVGCATKSFVKEQVTAAESKFDQKVTETEANLGKRAEAQETNLRETAEQTGENRESIAAAARRLEGLDARVGEVDASATGARAKAEEAAARAEQANAASRDAEARLAQRLAGRNSYRVLDTKAVHFDFGRIDIRRQDVITLEEVAKALAADPNAILELQGFADTQGTDRHNRELARERVEAVIRYLMQHHNIELRQLHGIAMGNVGLAPGEKATPETMARARRVDLRVLTPWSSWEERTELDRNPLAPPSTIVTEPPVNEPSALPAEVQQSESSPVNALDSPGRQRLPDFLRDITPQELGGK